MYVPEPFVVVERPPVETLRPWADGRLLARVVTNLVRNAACFAASRVDVHWQRDGEYFELMVDDDGPGLAPPLRDAVLQRGVRADEAAPGSGFGLAIVREIADVYGGAIVPETSPLGGLRAQLFLPAAG